MEWGRGRQPGHSAATAARRDIRKRMQACPSPFDSLRSLRASLAALGTSSGMAPGTAGRRGSRKGGGDRRQKGAMATEAPYRRMRFGAGRGHATPSASMGVGRRSPWVSVPCFTGRMVGPRFTGRMPVPRFDRGVESSGGAQVRSRDATFWRTANKAKDSDKWRVNLHSAGSLSREVLHARTLLRPFDCARSYAGRAQRGRGTRT